MGMNDWRINIEVAEQTTLEEWIGTSQDLLSVATL
jgi:hypothetical protein